LTVPSENLDRRRLGPSIGRAARWIALINATAALLTNGYTLRFFEPTVSRGTLVLVSIFVAVVFAVVERKGFPLAGELVSAARRLVVPALLVVILATAFGLRHWGISSGLPQSYVPDEYDYVHSALKMLKTGDFNPKWWYYPSLQPYLAATTYLGVYLAELPNGRWSSIHQVTEEDMLYWGRFLGVAFGTLTVLLTFFVGKLLCGPWVGLTAAALLAVFPGAVEHGQHNKPDVILYFTSLLSVLVCLRYLEKGGRAYAVACGLAMGLTTASKYNGVLVAVVFVLAVASRLKGKMFARSDLYIGLGMAALTFIATNPYFMADFSRFLEHVSFDIYSYSYAGRPGAEGVDNWATHASYMARYGAGLAATLAGLAGLALALHRFDARVLVFLSFPVLFYSHYSAQKINWPGNLITVYPFLAILAGYAVVELVHWISDRPRARRYRIAAPFAVAAITLLLMLSPLRTSVRLNEQLTLPDTGNQAREWMNGVFPPGTRFAVERHAPVPDRKRFRVTQEARIIMKSVKSYREQGVQYLIVSSQVYDRFGPEHRVTKAYARLFQICSTVKEFEPLPDRIQGPTIRILKIPGEQSE
jgi:4-amino-4-deoxy-L-arabinose transferase-like glycosyltransferase